jgi:hypothetical protein
VEELGEPGPAIIVTVTGPAEVGDVAAVEAAVEAAVKDGVVRTIEPATVSVCCPLVKVTADFVVWTARMPLGYPAPLQ